VRLPQREGVAILSANALGIALAKALRDGGRSVVFIDSNPQKSRSVEEAGFSVVFGNAIQERTMQRARFEMVEIAVALTGNKTLNGVFVSRAKEVFGVPKGLVAATQTDGGLVAELVEREEADLVFDGHHDMQRWEVRWRRGDVEVVRRRFRVVPRPEGDEESSDAEPVSSGERFVILAVDRAGRVSPMSMSFRPQKGDEAVVAIHVPEREDAFRVLESMGWFEAPQMVEEEEGAEPAAESGPRTRVAS
jgi:hypothetical protein